MAKAKKVVEQELVAKRTAFHVAFTHMSVLTVVQTTIRRLETERRAVLQEYVLTKGQTDWVWLEETLSGDLADEFAGRTHARPWVTPPLETPAQALVSLARYLAAFTMVVAYIKALHPEVKAPLWYDGEMAAMRGDKAPAAMPAAAEMIRDAFLEGRDAEAVEMLRSELGLSDRAIYWDVAFWGNRGRPVLPAIDLEAGTTYAVVSGSDWLDDIDGAFEAVGIAIQMYIEQDKRPVGVRIDEFDEGEDSALIEEWEGVVVFAIAESPTALRAEFEIPDDAKLNPTHR